MKVKIFNWSPSQEVIGRVSLFEKGPRKGEKEFSRGDSGYGKVIFLAGNQKHHFKKDRYYSFEGEVFEPADKRVGFMGNITNVIDISDIRQFTEYSLSFETQQINLSGHKGYDGFFGEDWFILKPVLTKNRYEISESETKIFRNDVYYDVRSEKVDFPTYEIEKRLALWIEEASQAPEWSTVAENAIDVFARYTKVKYELDSYNKKENTGTLNTETCEYIYYGKEVRGILSFEKFAYIVVWSEEKNNFIIKTNILRFYNKYYKKLTMEFVEGEIIFGTQIIEGTDPVAEKEWVYVKTVEVPFALVKSDEQKVVRLVTENYDPDAGEMKNRNLAVQTNVYPQVFTEQLEYRIYDIPSWLKESWKAKKADWNEVLFKARKELDRSCSFCDPFPGEAWFVVSFERKSLPKKEVPVERYGQNYTEMIDDFEARKLIFEGEGKVNQQEVFLPVKSFSTYSTGYYWKNETISMADSKCGSNFREEMHKLELANHIDDRLLKLFTGKVEINSKALIEHPGVETFTSLFGESKIYWFYQEVSGSRILVDGKVISLDFELRADESGWDFDKRVNLTDLLASLQASISSDVFTLRADEAIKKSSEVSQIVYELLKHKVISLFDRQAIEGRLSLLERNINWVGEDVRYYKKTDYIFMIEFSGNTYMYLEAIETNIKDLENDLVFVKNCHDKVELVQERISTRGNRGRTNSQASTANESGESETDISELLGGAFGSGFIDKRKK